MAKAVRAEKIQRSGPRRKSKSASVMQMWRSSLGKAATLVLSLGAIAGVFWAADGHWVNFPFHDTSVALTLERSQSYAKQLDKDNEDKLHRVVTLIDRIQRDQQIQTAQNQALFLMKQEMGMRESMAKIRATGKPISATFQAKLDEVTSERLAAENELKRLMQQRPDP